MKKISRAGVCCKGFQTDGRWVGCDAYRLFLGVDGFYLNQEQRFRRLYNAVRKMNEDEIDFAMDTD